MITKDFFNTITNSNSDFLQEFLDILKKFDIHFCVVGGLTVNAYAEPVVSLDLDLVVVSDHLEELFQAIQKRFKINRYFHIINISSSNSN